MVDTLELYSPTLKGLQEVHGFATEHLEQLVFDQKIADKHAATAAYLYGGSPFPGAAHPQVKQWQCPPSLRKL